MTGGRGWKMAAGVGADAVAHDPSRYRLIAERVSTRLALIHLAVVTSLYIAAADVLQLLQCRIWQLANNSLEHSNIEAIECCCIGALYFPILHVYWARWCLRRGKRRRTAMPGADLCWGGVVCKETTLFRWPLIWVRALHGVVCTDPQELWCIQSGASRGNPDALSRFLR